MRTYDDKLFEFFKHLSTVVTGVTLLMVAIAGQIPREETTASWLLGIALGAEVFALGAAVTMLFWMALAADEESHPGPTKLIAVAQDKPMAVPRICLTRRELLGPMGMVIHVASPLLFLLGITCFVVFAWVNLLK